MKATLSERQRGRARVWSPLLYPARALGFVGGAYAILFFLLPWAAALNLLEMLNLALATASAGLLKGLGFLVVRSGTLLSLPGGAVVVTNECNAIGEWLLLAGAMLALTRVEWWKRLLGVAAGGLVLMALNVLRISLLVYLEADVPAWFLPVHEQLAPLALVLATMGYFVVWLRSVGGGLVAR